MKPEHLASALCNMAALNSPESAKNNSSCPKLHSRGQQFPFMQGRAAENGAAQPAGILAMLPVLDSPECGNHIIGGSLDLDSEFERRLSVGAQLACHFRAQVKQKLGAQQQGTTSVSNNFRHSADSARHSAKHNANKSVHCHDSVTRHFHFHRLSLFRHNPASDKLGTGKRQQVTSAMLWAHAVLVSTTPAKLWSS